MAEVIVNDATSNSGGGAFKVVNSWGTSGSWETIHDGHYWMTYNTMKALNLPCFYYYNDTSAIYQPTVIAEFQISHSVRNQCKILFGLGDPADPYITKEFQARYQDTIYSGALPFPDHTMALDLSEFAGMINSANLFMTITTGSGTPAGTVVSFVVRFYSGTTGTYLGSVIGANGSFAGDYGVTAFTAATAGAIPSTDLLPTSRAVQGITNAFVEDLPSAVEMDEDMAVIGVREPGRRYTNVVDGRYGTGWVPPSPEEWATMKKLRNFQSAMHGGAFADQEIDHTTSQYFPPIGNQGSEGSCVCYSTAYYIHTFYMGREHSTWNLTGTTWTSGTPSLGTPGYPSENRDKIFSPDFIYHQINRGADNGSSYPIAMTLLADMGCSTWQNMPYNQSDSTTFPSSAAFLDAPKYRGSNMNSLTGLKYGYFIIRTDADVNLLKTLMMNSYLVSCSIDADSSDSDGVRLYQYRDMNDVIDRTTFPAMTLNHAQTIVGFKDGTTWHPAAPDD